MYKIFSFRERERDEEIFREATRDVERERERGGKKKHIATKKHL